MTVVYSRRALAQLDEILQFLASRDPKVAAAATDRFEALVAMLARRPAMGRPTNLVDVRVFRAAPYPYLIFYRTDRDSGITVLRVRHTARDRDWRSGV